MGLSSRAHSQGQQTAQEMKEEVVQHLKEQENLDHSLPSSIVIGPFTVSVKTVRQALSKKRRALASAVLDHLALKLRSQVDDVSHKFREQKNRRHVMVKYSWVL